jgi:hypothetical protein
MFVYWAALHCDRCGESFEKVTASVDDDDQSPDELCVALEQLAHQSGWFRYKNGITCDSCLLDIAYQRELTRQDVS